MFHGGQQQHYRGHVGDDIRQYEGRCEQGAEVLQWHPSGSQIGNQPCRYAGFLQRVVDHEQADEEHEQLPVDQTQHLA